MDHHRNQTTCGTLKELVAKSIAPVNKHAERACRPSDLSKSWIVWSRRAPLPHPLSSGNPDHDLSHFMVADLRWSLSLWFHIFVVDAPLMELEQLGLVGFAVNELCLWVGCCVWVLLGCCYDWVLVSILSNFDLSFVSFYWSVNPAMWSDHPIRPP